MTEYDRIRELDEQRRGNLTPGSPEAAAKALLEVVDAEQPPLRVLFGTDSFDRVRTAYEGRLCTRAQWQHLATRAQG